MRRLSNIYTDNTAQLDKLLRVDENFDIIKKPLKIGRDEVTFYYIDGFVKDTVMQKLMLSLTSLDGLGKEDGGECTRGFVRAHVAYVETDVTDSLDTMLSMVLSGASLMIGSRFGEWGVIIDTRSYPARETSEPENDRVMRGARDGFVETLISNTALIRRRIRDTSLTMEYMPIGSASKTDVVLCYMRGRADDDYVTELRHRLRSIDTDSLTLGHESLAECLIRTRWYNPFPKIRSTERPDAAAAQLLEGSVLILADNSPEAMVLPTSIFDFVQETNDYYFPPLTASFIRVVRHTVCLLTLFMVPVWYMLVRSPNAVPDWLSFVIPQERGRIPILAQLLIVEFVVDGLKMASMNTPSMLSNSLSVVGGLILGDFAVDIGWLIPEVILYMAFVAIANFSQRSYELGYALKFMRIGLLILVALFGATGFILGTIGIILLLMSNRTVNGEHSYLYPLIPFDGRACLAVFFRVKKKDVRASDNYR